MLCSDHMPRAPLFYLGADHAGFALKEAVKALLNAQKIPFEDLSPDLIPSDDYPVIGALVAKRVAKNQGSQGVLCCGSGMGIAMAANRFRKVRAAVIHTPEDAVLAREHNHANILALGGRILTPSKLSSILAAWLKTKPSRAARHLRRIQTLDTL